MPLSIGIPCISFFHLYNFSNHLRAASTHVYFPSPDFITKAHTETEESILSSRYTDHPQKCMLLKKIYQARLHQFPWLQRVDILLFQQDK